ncbi:HAD-superfamily cof-like hydrolase [Listeria grayi FSL F6-1183]|uniref:HAD-superfamily cof-like hydrolase n=1 Tax=Listeria grayi FSL F6-1183 TaxID=1265827 RepID=A0A829R5P7_LISGR|nr:HAD-superfamily cof-like hydrolase [Listeria grayi FSL F6-1183]
MTTTAAFGDNENDAGMLEASQIGVAVANAIPTTLERADEVTLDNESGGVGVYIQEKLLGNK